MTEVRMTEIQELVTCATNETLAGPEWTLNMEICDCMNTNHSLCEEIARLLQRRLQSEKPKVALLALILTETVVKNGPSAIHNYIGSTEFLQEIAALSDGSMGVDVQNQALLLIRQWADAFQGTELQAFQDIYRQLEIQGIKFPEVENNVPIFTPPSSTGSAFATTEREESYAPAAFGRRTREQQLEKLQDDLKIVQQNIELMKCLRSRGETGEQLEDVLDFMRQCQPRMNTLIEGGVMGKIDEHTLEKCLNVNDNLMKALEGYSKTETKSMMTFDLPPRTSHMTEEMQDLAELNCNEGGRALDSTAVLPGPVHAAHSPLTNAHDGMV